MSTWNASWKSEHTYRKDFEKAFRSAVKDGVISVPEANKLDYWVTNWYTFSDSFEYKTEAVTRIGDIIEEALSDSQKKVTFADPSIEKSLRKKFGEVGGPELIATLDPIGGARSKDTENRPTQSSLELLLEEKTKAPERQKSASRTRHTQQIVDLAFENVVGMDKLRRAASDIISIFNEANHHKEAAEYYEKNGDIEASKAMRNAANKIFEQRPTSIVLTGNSGTGKSFGVKKLAKALKMSGALKKGHVVEVGRGELTSDVMGGTSKAVEEQFKKAKGGILFIDEAYALNTSSAYKKNASEFGQEALREIIRLMTHPDYQDVMVVMAGYKDKMDDMLNTNQGLRNRFETVVELKDYSRDEIADIYFTKVRSEGYVIKQSDEPAVRAAILKALEPAFDYAGKPIYPDLGNGRLAEQLWKQTIRNISNQEKAWGLKRIQVKPEHIELPFWYQELLVKSFDPNYREAIDTMFDGLVGLDNIRQNVEALAKLGERIYYLEEQLNIESEEQAIQNIKLQLKFWYGKYRRHVLFIGHPGTAKTMVGRQFAKVMKMTGHIAKDTLVEVKGGEIDTVKDLKDLMNQARGGVLFIDEMYAMHDHIVHGLMDLEEQIGRTIVIGAGYPHEMDVFLSKNSGLKRRFPNQWRFNSYTLDGHVKIFESVARRTGIELKEGVLERLRELLKPLFHRKTTLPIDKMQGNGSFVEQILGESLMHRDVRTGHSILEAKDLRLPESEKGNEEGYVPVGF